MEYTISHIEIIRRKKAYATLAISIFIGVILASILFNVSVSIGGYAAIVFILFLLGAFSFQFFRTLAQTRITISNQLLKKTINGVTEEYPLDNINRVQIKWTTNNTIREMYIWLHGGKNVIITGVNHFEEFKKELIDTLDKNIAIKETHESVDFDHPLFYSLLGLPISTIGILIFSIAPNLQYQYIKIGGIVFIIYLVLFGIYFIIAKPISKRSGNMTTSSDYIMAGVMLCSALSILFVFRGK